VSHTHLTISYDTGQLKVVRDAVIELAMPCLPETAHMVALAVDEALANVMLHGRDPLSGENAQNNAIEVDIDSDSQRLMVCIADRGPAYNPCRAVVQDAPDRVLARKRNGMGVSIMRRVMDDIHYDRTADERNELRLIKYIRPSPVSPVIPASPAGHSGGGERSPT